MTALTHWDGRRESLSWLDETTTALPYQLLASPRVLVLGAGGGAEILQAIYHGAPEIRAVELNPAMLELLRASLHDPRVRFQTGDARGFVRADRSQFDLIQVAPVDSYGGSGAGVQAMSENLLDTVEAITDYYARSHPTASGIDPSGQGAATRGAQAFRHRGRGDARSRDRTARTACHDPRPKDDDADPQERRAL